MINTKQTCQSVRPVLRWDKSKNVCNRSSLVGMMCECMAQPVKGTPPEVAARRKNTGAPNFRTPTQFVKPSLLNGPVPHKCAQPTERNRRSNKHTQAKGRSVCSQKPPKEHVKLTSPASKIGCKYWSSTRSATWKKKSKNWNHDLQ